MIRKKEFVFVKNIYFFILIFLLIFIDSFNYVFLKIKTFYKMPIIKKKIEKLLEEK